MDVVRVRLNYAQELRPEAFPPGSPLQCLVPNEQLVPGDVMLAKKIVLKTTSGVRWRWLISSRRVGIDVANLHQRQSYTL